MRETVELNGRGFCINYKNRIPAKERTELRNRWLKDYMSCPHKTGRYTGTVCGKLGFPYKKCLYNNCPLKGEIK
jgi:hypothetical protein